MNGFSLVELMLSLSLGLALSGVMLQGLMAEGQNGARFSRLLRERAAQRRALELIKQDLAQATALSETPEHEQHGCSLAGRTPVLHFSTAAGPITYSVGLPPNAIWRGRVLMRCGPAVDLQGGLSAGAALQNRVVLDGLASQASSWEACGSFVQGQPFRLGEQGSLPFSACLDQSSRLLAVRIELDLVVSLKSQRLTQHALMLAPAVTAKA